MTKREKFITNDNVDVVSDNMVHIKAKDTIIAIGASATSRNDSIQITEKVVGRVMLS